METQIEITYRNQLSRDYELLYRLLTEDQRQVLCFMDQEKDGVYRKMEIAKSPMEFQSLYLAFCDVPEPKKPYIEFCARYNLTFIRPFEG